MIQLWVYQNMLAPLLILLLVMKAEKFLFGLLGCFVVFAILADFIWVCFGGHGIFLGNTMSIGVAAATIPIWCSIFAEWDEL